jgi:hypothetical protein
MMSLAHRISVPPKFPHGTTAGQDFRHQPRVRAEFERLKEIFELELHKRLLAKLEAGD